jgi:hypothetical protein
MNIKARNGKPQQVIKSGESTLKGRDRASLLLLAVLVRVIRNSEGHHDTAVDTPYITGDVFCFDQRC